MNAQSKIKPQTVMDIKKAMLRTLADGRERTVSELAERIGAPSKRVSTIATKMMRVGLVFVDIYDNVLILRINPSAFKPRKKPQNEAEYSQQMMEQAVLDEHTPKMPENAEAKKNNRGSWRAKIYDLMSDGKWRTYDEIRRELGATLSTLHKTFSAEKKRGIYEPRYENYMDGNFPRQRVHWRMKPQEGGE